MVLFSFSAIGQNRYQLCQAAKSCIGVPYQSGGTQLSGFDCSGFTQFVFKKQNIELPRTSSGQAAVVKSVKTDKGKPGDLLFFGKSKKKIQHVGLIVRNEKGVLEMIHSSSSSGVILTNVLNSKYWSERLLYAGQIKKKKL